jgi:hypothetical protein
MGCWVQADVSKLDAAVMRCKAFGDLLRWPIPNLVAGTRAKTGGPVARGG